MARAGRTVGLDLSGAMLKKLASKAAQRGLPIDLQEGNVLDLPFAECELSVATTAFMLLYLTPEEKRRVVAETHRVLAPGGRLGCLSSLGEVADIFPTREGWDALLRDGGFSEVHVEERYDVFRLVTARRR